MERRKRTLGYLIILPAILIIVFVLLFPLLYALYLSFFKVTLGRQIKLDFVGIKNFIDIFSDSDWWESFLNTIYFVLSDILVGIPLGFISALLLNKKIRLKALVLSIVLLPYILPPIVHALIWKWAFNSDYGFINMTLMSLGIIKNNVYWLTNPNLALPALIVANLWQGTAFATIVYLGGMKSIPSELYEASQIDGASNWQQIRFITIPMLRPFTNLLLVMKTIMTFKIFELVYAVTGGGPAGTTKVVSYSIYKSAFEAFKFGKASAMSYTLLGIVAVIVLFYQKLFKTENEIL